MSARNRHGTCVYCGRIGRVTKDHVPPKTLFAPGMRSDLITVLACLDCNKSFALDDEYFRIVIGLRDDLPNSAHTKYLREINNKTLERPESKGLKESLRAQIKYVEVNTPAGIYLGNVAVLGIDDPRLNATCTRIIKGLFAHFFKTRLPESHGVSIHFMEMQKDASALHSPEVQEGLRLLSQSGTYKSSNEVLEACALQTDDDPFSSFWYVRIVRTFGFLAYTVPKTQN